MFYQGEYGQPLGRTQIIHCPVVPGSVTARFEVQSLPKTADDELTIAIVENDCDVAAGVQFKECDEHVSGASRTNVGSALSIVPGGVDSVSISPSKRYLEVWGTNSAREVNSHVRIQLQSKMRWNILGFNKDDAQYAKVLWQPAGL